MKREKKGKEYKGGAKGNKDKRVIGREQSQGSNVFVV